MIVSIHLARLGPLAAAGVLRRSPRPDAARGLLWATTVAAAPMRARILPAFRPGWVGLIAAWDSDEACASFIQADPLAAKFEQGWEIRTKPLRVAGAWAPLPDLPRQPLPTAADEPLAALTLGRLRPHLALPFLRAAAAAEAAALADPDQLLTIALARPPLVSTFSVWRTAAAMHEYALGASSPHRAAVRADRDRPFHRESAFVRLRPYASRGSWLGGEPLAAAQLPSALNL